MRGEEKERESLREIERERERDEGSEDSFARREKDWHAVPRM